MSFNSSSKMHCFYKKEYKNTKAIKKFKLTQVKFQSRFKFKKLENLLHLNLNEEYSTNKTLLPKKKPIKL